MADILIPTDFADFTTGILNANNNDVIIGEQLGSPFQGANNRNLDIGALDPLTIRGETGVASDIVIDVQNAANSRAFLFDNGESNSVILKDLRITDGNQAVSPGGGILIDDSSPLLENLIVDSCTTGIGGNGAAIDVRGTAPLGSTVTTTFTDLVIEYNTGYPGGIMFVYYVRVTLNNTIIRNNTSPANAGGFYIHEYSRTTWNNCQIYDNTAAIHGGAGIVGGHDIFAAAMNNCLIYGNTATTGSGGAFYVISNDTNLNFDNSTVTHNHAGDDGGAIKMLHISDVFFDNTIVWGNTAANPGYSIDNAGTRWADLDYSCYQNGLNDNTGNVVADAWSFTTDPLFVAGPLGNYYLSQIAAGQGADTPCLNAGDNTAVFYGLDTRTTRTDSVTDAGIVDTGWHYEPVAAPVGLVPMLQTVTT